MSIEDGCTWGNGDRQVGNWAPVNLGVGYSNGATWISIMPNRPTTNPDLDFKIKIEGTGLSSKCYFENGKFYLDGQEMDGGCTVSFTRLFFDYSIEFSAVHIADNAFLHRLPSLMVKPTTSSIKRLSKVNNLISQTRKMRSRLFSSFLLVALYIRN